jgi:hypothetical protein
MNGPPGVDPSVSLAVSHAVLSHPECPPSEVQVQRLSQDRRYAELLVCGTIRRHQDITPVVVGRSVVAPTWIEVASPTGV